MFICVSAFLHALGASIAIESGPLESRGVRTRWSVHLEGHVMTRRRAWGVVAFVLLCLLPAAAHAQSSLTGVVKDTSGAVLPGVTVEAASPVLIEKTRTATTDGRGRYEIVGLRPGDYKLMGECTATIDVDMKVGAGEETITVSGEAPIIDITNAKRERVMTSEVIES